MVDKGGRRRLHTAPLTIIETRAEADAWPLSAFVLRTVPRTQPAAK